jgi:hypothetical protein
MKYRIRASDGADFGIWEGETEYDALEAMYADANEDIEELYDSLDDDEWIGWYFEPIDEQRMKALLIGDWSEGMTAVEIYNYIGELVWSHRWFTDGGDDWAGYIAGLCEAYDRMRQCADVASYDGCDVDEDGAPVRFDADISTGVMLQYDTASGWSLGERILRLEQSHEIIDALMLVGMIKADGEHPDYVGDDVVTAIADHIRNAK